MRVHASVAQILKEAAGAARARPPGKTPPSRTPGGAPSAAGVIRHPAAVGHDPRSDPGLPAHAETEKGLVEAARPEAAKVQRPTWTKPSSPSRSTIESASPPPELATSPRGAISRRAIPRGGARGTRGSRARGGASARSTWRSFSAVMGVPYGKREDRQAMAGLSQVGRSAAGEIPDLRLAKPGVDQRRAHTALPRRLMPGRWSPEIVHRGAVHQVRKPSRLGDAAEPRRTAPPCRRSSGWAGSPAYSGLSSSGSRRPRGEGRCARRAAAPRRARPRRSSRNRRSPGTARGPQGLPRRPAEERGVHPPENATATRSSSRSRSSRRSYFACVPGLLAARPAGPRSSTCIISLKER